MKWATANTLFKLMKNVSCVVCLLTLLICAAAQTSETFDIASFKSPSGWNKQDKNGVRILSTASEAKGTCAMLVLYASGQSTGNPQTDFANDWQQFVSGQLGIKDQPQVEPATKAGGWDMITGGAAFKNDQGTNAVILNTYSGFGKTFSVAAIFNSQDYLPAIEAFISSISLRQTSANSQPAPAVDNGATSIVGTWGMSSSGVQRIDDYKNPYAVNNYGYLKGQYSFNADGTYSFVAKTFKMTFDKILLVKENGSYQISGDNMTVIPQKSVIEAWSKKGGVDKWGTLLSRQNRTLEKVTYRFTKHYFSGIDQWNLVLQADKPTERDGPFSSNTSFRNAWYYAPISANNPVIELP